MSLRSEADDGRMTRTRPYPEQVEPRVDERRLLRWG